MEQPPVPGASLNDDALRALKWRLDVMENRRQQADGFAWAAPGLAIAAQAFLLTIALGADTKPLGRLLSSLAGLVALLATAHLMAKQAYNFDVYEAVIERDRRPLGLPGVQMDALTDVPEEPLPRNTSYWKRRWWEEETWRNRFVVSRKAVKVWGFALVVLVAIDAFLIVYSLVALAGADPGWLSSGEKASTQLKRDPHRVLHGTGLAVAPGGARFGCKEGLSRLAKPLSS